MKIDWKITKKRGNFRPVLHYTLALEDYEVDLGMPTVRIESSIPKPPDAGWTHCWPEQNERGSWAPSEFYLLMTPSHKTVKVSESVKLPWREDNAYPEVERDFERLRDAFERILAQTVKSAPLNASGSLETSAPAKKTIAPAVAAQRILKVVKP